LPGRRKAPRLDYCARPTPARDACTFYAIVGNGGNDKIKAKAGNDRICGGAGKDKLVAAKGSKDRCFGGPGRDTGKGCDKGKL
jgi:RTX calcium-binding nonapeptide repeat (4 copies)